jgi:hypothetical protein
MIRFWNLESVHNRLVLGRVDLEAALDQIQGHNASVGDAAWQDTAQTAQGKVFAGAELAAVAL